MSNKLLEKELEYIWSQKEVNAVFQAAVGHSGGLFTSWDAELFDLINLESLDNCLGVSLKDKSIGLMLTFLIFMVLKLAQERKHFGTILQDLALPHGDLPQSS